MVSGGFLLNMRTSWIPTCQQANQENNNREDARTVRPRCAHIIPGNEGIRLRFSEELNYGKCWGGSARAPPAFCALGNTENTHWWVL